ncbi:hypothetical protein AB1Y20_019779 [Prymnesium parvum]|uniref:Sulfotransferase n=1 Tax=Prymnesium parvum TaxID=97485 RepID=A0AB34JS16_PRYPA
MRPPALLLPAAPALLLAAYLLLRGAPPPPPRRITLSSAATPPSPASAFRRPTPLPAVRAAAAAYFPAMFDGTPTALPNAFLEGDANPCWRVGAQKHCLPAFLLLGVYQAGVRDLYCRLLRHPGVARRPASSPSYYSQVRPDWPSYVRGMHDSVDAGRLIGEASAVTFHFIWVHQEKFNQPYVEAMGRFWRECNARTNAQKLEVPHRDCMARRMPEAREADAAMARKAGLPMHPDKGAVAQERTFNVPQLMRAAYGERSPLLIVMLRLPWRRMHSAFWNYVHYRNRFGASAEGESKWAAESVAAFRRCEANFTTDQCALSFESLTRENEEVFYHCDQLIKGMYHVFMPRWKQEFSRILALRAEQYYSSTRQVLERVIDFLGLQPPANRSGWSELLSPAKQVAGYRPKDAAAPLKRHPTCTDGVAKREGGS